MFESVVVDVLNRFLGDYVVNLDKSQLTLGIWGGNETAAVPQFCLPHDYLFIDGAGPYHLGASGPWLAGRRHLPPPFSGSNYVKRVAVPGLLPRVYFLSGGDGVMGAG